MMRADSVVRLRGSWYVLKPILSPLTDIFPTVFFTGGGTVGRIIATAAGKHLTPVTLELGGKSPIIVDPNYDIKLAAKRILWGKISNCGQVRVYQQRVYLNMNYRPR